ncbi:MAG: glycine cleavage system protein GcvH [Coriobacteriia bacterium]|nr:glycine cleavage system protein GcvH [Coriobacteriia bacterium]
MAAPADRMYSLDHEWVLVKDGEATIGITEYASQQLGSLVFVDMPDVGESFAAAEVFGEVESVKSVSELLLPVAGEITAVNDALEDSPETINDDPYGQGWIIRLRLDDDADLSHLIDAAAYDASLA